MALRGLGIDDTHNDDRAMAGTTVVEGDAMVLTTDYSTECVAADDLLKDMPQFLTMDQTALNNSPSFFQQSLMFPYLQGEIFMDMARQNKDKNRDYVFKNPPRTSEQVIHPEKYFGTRDDPSSITLLEEAKTSGTVSVNLGIALPRPPEGYRKLELNRMGELGVRLIFEDKLGMAIANDAAVGWDGDAYLVRRNADGKDLGLLGKRLGFRGGRAPVCRRLRDAMASQQRPEIRRRPASIQAGVSSGGLECNGGGSRQPSGGDLGELNVCYAIFTTRFSPSSQIKYRDLRRAVETKRDCMNSHPPAHI